MVNAERAKREGLVDGQVVDESAGGLQGAPGEIADKRCLVAHAGVPGLAGRCQDAGSIGRAAPPGGRVPGEV